MNQLDGQFAINNSSSRKKKNQDSNKKTVQKSINYAEENMPTYSTILYDED